MKKTDQTEIAKILGVDRSVICRAIERGRIKNGVRKLANGRYEIEIAAAVLDWYGNVNHAQDRGNHKAPGINVSEFLEQQKSRRMREHYQALNEQISYDKEKGTLVDRSKLETELFEAARDTREKILNVPTEVAPKLLPLDKTADIMKVLKDTLTKALKDLTHGK